ncbi:MAG TPA: hypothetical protein VL689_08180 [Paraburkholderia sp.]|nr:hypothetical protein [Paraburkholderia sp.]
MQCSPLCRVKLLIISILSIFSSAYFAFWHTPGHNPQTRTFDSKTLAKQWAEQVEADLRAGRCMQRIEVGGHTVRERIDKYREEVMLTCKPRREADQGGERPRAGYIFARAERGREGMGLARNSTARQGSRSDASTTNVYAVMDLYARERPE